MTRFPLTLALALSLAAPASFAAPTPADRCEAAKNLLAGTYANCRHRAVAKAVRRGETADFSRCDSRFAHRWSRAEAAGGGACPVSEDAGSIGALVAAGVAAASSAIGGGGTPACGDDSINAAGEVCDGADLGSTTCADLGWAGGDLACTPNCRFDTSGCSVCPDAGLVSGGFCWLLGSEGASCDDACSAAGLAYDAATKTHAGSDDPNGINCLPILTAFGLSWEFAFEFHDQLAGIGCAHNTGGDFAALAVSPPTTAAAAEPGYRRACACRMLP